MSSSTSSSFYVTLPSNGCKQYTSENRASNYKTYFPEPLDVEGKWEVALVEMQYPLTWKLLENKAIIGLLMWDDGYFVEDKPSDKDKVIDLAYKNQIKHRPNLTAYYTETDIPAGFYASPYHLAKAIHAELIRLLYTIYGGLKSHGSQKQPEECLLLELDEADGLISFSSKYFKMELVLFKEHRDLTEILGFIWNSNAKFERYYLRKIPKKEDLCENKTSRGECHSIKPPSMFHSPALYVYSDVVKNEQVGDVKVQLLRTVHIDGKMGTSVCKEFQRPYYKPVAKQYINDIVLEIKDDTGKDLDFTTGKVICVLHFRRCGLAV